MYLAVQVRDNSRFITENTQSLRATNEISSNQISVNLRLFYLDNPQLLDIQQRGFRGEPLQAAEAEQCNHLLGIMFESHLTFFVQHARELTGDDIWNYWSRTFDDMCRLPGVASWWERSRSQIPSEFQAYIDEKVA